MPPRDLARALTPFLTGVLGVVAPEPDYVARVAATLSPRAKTLVEMAEMARFYFQDPRPYEDQAAAKFLTRGNLPVLEEAARRLEALPDPLSEEALAALFTGLAAETGRKMKDVAQPVRVALTGRTASPGLYEIISILGKTTALPRINNAIRFAAGIT
jgi:glutamyl-tRNA synthetase